jgi:membrane protease YdiL (CAAX protease family)
MNFFDENSDPRKPEEPAQHSAGDPANEHGQGDQESLDELAARIVVHPSVTAEPSDLGGAGPQQSDPISVDLAAPPPLPPVSLPPDLTLPWPLPRTHLLWSWLHFVCFGIFCLGSLIAIQIGLFIHYSSGNRMSVKQFEQLFQSRPGLAIGMNVFWFFLVFAFLYISLPIFSGASFWRTLGWQKLVSKSGAPSNPWVYFGSGIALAVAVGLTSSRMKTPDNLPIQDLLKSRTGALLLMSMAVLVAPLVEETVFRGYLYPLFACSYSRVMRFFGGNPQNSFQIGSWFAIVLTGGLFGLMHGAQLGWTWGLVAMLVTVGIIFTFVRARAGTVLASFLLHLGYNSMIAFSAIVTTHGFTRMPPHP